MKFRNGIILSLLVFGGLCSNVFAATNPSEADETSTGTSDISVVIPKLVKISGINDLTSTTYTGSGGLDLNDNVCVYSNMATGSGLYTVKVTGSDSPGTGSGAAFNVGNSSSNQVIPFEVEWNDVTGTGGVAVSHDVDLTTQNGFSNLPDCGGGTNANFRVTMANEDMLAVKPGTYTNTITILITPE